MASKLPQVLFWMPQNSNQCASDKLPFSNFVFSCPSTFVVRAESNVESGAEVSENVEETASGIVEQVPGTESEQVSDSDPVVDEPRGNIGLSLEILWGYSPNIKEIKVVSHRKVRRARLYHLRDKLPRLSTFK